MNTAPNISEHPLNKWVEWINKEVAPNEYAISKGSIGCLSGGMTNVNELPTILEKYLNQNKKYFSRVLTFNKSLGPHYTPVFPQINLENIYIARRLMMDELTELEIDKDPVHKTLLLARYNSKTFEKDLSTLICKFNEVQDSFSRMIMRTHLANQNEIFRQINILPVTILVKSLEELTLSNSPQTLQFDKDLKSLILTSVKNGILTLNLRETLEIDTITQSLTDLQSDNQDNLLNNMIKKAKDNWVERNYFETTKDLWNIFERIKTLQNADKKKKESAEELISAISQNLFPKEKDQLAFIDMLNCEFTSLTKIGNENTIRHTEIDKTEIHDKNEVLKYYIKRISALLELILSTLKL